MQLLGANANRAMVFSRHLINRTLESRAAVERALNQAGLLDDSADNEIKLSDGGNDLVCITEQGTVYMLDCYNGSVIV